MNFSPIRIIAAGWALVFAALHVIWAAGVPIGLGATPPMRGWFLAYDVAVAAGCLIGVAVALWGRRWMLIVVGAVPLVRGLIGIGLLVQQLITGSYSADPTLWVEPWFVLGGVLFMIAARRPSMPLIAADRR
ncbi:hypothetical protein [Microlunatus soli]|uniref:DUF3995 domain-containing protein n=1 Tax=Microlunatus soli TaxID=630515 RepID=A0A1H1SLY3_9ACTN|nr:hypothetical protein [Microlunatus soli]SDS48985.1 hypothetical protein SAMN04489812_2064 [Microlunatus soli]